MSVTPRDDNETLSTPFWMNTMRAIQETYKHDPLVRDLAEMCKELILLADSNEPGQQYLTDRAQKATEGLT